jgi:hypothetical protein
MTKKAAKKSAAIVKVKGEVVNDKDRAKLETRAKEVDAELQSSIGGVQDSFVYMSTLLAEVQEKELWLYLADPRPKSKGFRSITDYANYRFGDMHKTKVYDLIAIASLTKGENKLSAAEVKKLGPKKAAELAKVPPAKRTREKIKAVQDGTLSSTRQIVHDTLNSHLPKDQQEEIGVIFARTLSSSVADKMEKFEEVGLALAANPLWKRDGEERQLAFADGDPQVNTRSKFWGFIILEIGKHLEAEFEEAASWLLAERARKVQQEERDAQEKKAAATKSKADKTVATRAQPKKITTKPNGHAPTRRDDEFPEYEDESQERRPRAH